MRKRALLASLAMGTTLGIAGVAAPGQAAAPAFSPSATQDGSSTIAAYRAVGSLATYTYCPTGQGPWIDYTDRGRGHLACTGYLVKVGVTCSNGAVRWSGSDGANAEWRPDYNKVDCPRGVSVNSRVSIRAQG
ncbi:hypothetical protein RM555_17055 [Micromonospora sp. DSM 115977]|uniref:Secreted protein n=1 Tax=Micromonospora reichwaldensis TaxID=3075516 RepID=A0ABU2WYV0_9ACTN|nr:hypothetical protein [Micromonospora sp. DSM 115977]MDT0530705.1 hypothetical protein [Micromonospora sp. DSM 115977]